MRAQIGQLEIEKIHVDPWGRLFVQPRILADEDFAFIYRAAMEVSWDPLSRSLFAPVPREWSQVQWYKQIVAAVADEYGTELYVTARTQWQNVSVEERREIEAWSTGA
jgi:hypothetical protein